MNLHTPFINATRAFYAYHAKKIRLNYYPLYLLIEPTNYCNMSCPMCPSSMLSSSQRGHMDFNLYKKIIDECKHYAVATGLYFRGEPLIHKDIFKMIECAKSNDILTCIHTNGVLLNNENAHKIIESKLDFLSISFDGFTQEAYAKNRPSANFNQVINNIKNFLTIKNDCNSKIPYTVIQTIITGTEKYPNFSKAMKEFYNYFNNLHFNERTIKKASSWGNTFKDNETFKFKKLEKKYHHCAYLWGMQTVLWDGKVMPCCVDFFSEYPVGNVTNDNLIDCWNSDKMILLRKKMIEKSPYSLIKCCQGCDSLWGESLLGMPVGLRRAMEMPFINIFGFGFEKIAKRISGNKLAFKLVK